MKKRRHRNLLALFLAATLTLASLPGTVMAEEIAADAENTVSTESTVGTESTSGTENTSDTESFTAWQRQRDVLYRTDMKENV